MEARIWSSTSGGTSSMPCSSRAWPAISCRISFSVSPWNLASQPGTISPHLNSFIPAPLLGVLEGSLPPRGARVPPWSADYTIVGVCRVLAYLGEPISLGRVLYETDSSLVHQTHSPRMMNKFLNLAGFGMAAWDPRSVRAEDPFTYRATRLPAFDPNLRSLSRKLAPTCLIAHVRGVTYGDQEIVAETNLHPFRFHAASVALAHNGHLREFGSMRYDLVEHIRPELAQCIQGTTDSEWIYALVLSQLDDPYGRPELRELVDAAAAALRLLREIRARHGIDTSSPVNL